MKYLFFIFILSYCNSIEYKLKGITSKQVETYYFGNQFAVSLTQVDKVKLDKIKIDLKNSFAMQKIENPEKIWDEINSISLEKYQILYFQLLPETRVFPEFIKFEFISNSERAEKIYSYYSESQETSVRTRYYYPAIIYPSLGGIYAYPTYSPLDSDVRIKLTHQYNFLLLFNKKINLDKLRVITAKGNFIDFEKEN